MLIVNTQSLTLARKTTMHPPHFKSSDHFEPCYFEPHYFEPWYDYHDPLVRQLCFAIASFNLLKFFPTALTQRTDIQFHDDTFWREIYECYQPRLKALDQHPAPLYEFVQQIKSTRLGLRFEALLWFWLADPYNQHFELLGHSIQHHHDGKTLGEMDFVVRNRADQAIEHWEVSLKFYLAEANLNIYTWIGLNPEDTFAQKLTHFAEKQFQFDHALGFRIDRRIAVMKGQLFLPTSIDNPIQDLPEWLNRCRRLGIWQSTAPKHHGENAPNWRRLEREEWLSPALRNNQKTPQYPIRFWTNGMYYSASTNQYFMMRFNKLSMLNNCSR